MSTTFGDPDQIGTARRKLLGLRLTRAISEYHAQFLKYLEPFNYNEEIQKDLLINRLKLKIAKQLQVKGEISRELLFEETINIAIQIDNAIEIFQIAIWILQLSQSGPYQLRTSRPELMNLYTFRNKEDFYKLMEEEMNRGHKEMLCLYCGELDHFAKSCHKEQKEPGIYQAAEIVEIIDEKGKVELNL